MNLFTLAPSSGLERLAEQCVHFRRANKPMKKHNKVEKKNQDRDILHIYKKQPISAGRFYIIEPVCFKGAVCKFFFGGGEGAMTKKKPKTKQNKKSPNKTLTTRVQNAVVHLPCELPFMETWRLNTSTAWEIISGPEKNVNRKPKLKKKKSPNLLYEVFFFFQSFFFPSPK